MKNSPLFAIANTSAILMVSSNLKMKAPAHEIPRTFSKILLLAIFIGTSTSIQGSLNKEEALPFI